MPRRLIAALTGGALLALLSGCALPIPVGPIPISHPDGPLVVPAVGECLESLNGRDADWRSSVPCTEPHLYDIVAIGEWPGMTQALDGRDPSRVFADINAYGTSALVEGYWAWASEFCETAARDALGWGGLDPRYGPLHVLPVGTWGFDMSLAARSDFVKGEHRTLCSIGWYEEHASAPGLTVAEDFFADATDATEECWIAGTATSTAVDCADAHTDQAVLRFDARAAFGDAFLRPVDEFDDEDWDLAYSMCVDLVSSLLPDLSESLGIWSWVRYPELWDPLASESPDPDTWYTMDCLVGSFDDERRTGDLLDAGAATATA